MKRPFRLVFLGLSITSSWGNGHATTYRALIKALHRLGHEIRFLERDVPWYAENRDMPAPPGCQVDLYDSLETLTRRFGAAVRNADAVILGSYVPDGAEVGNWILEHARGLRLFYDIDTPVTLGRLATGEPTYIAPQTVPLLDAYLSFSGGAALAKIENEYHAAIALPLYCSVDAELYAPGGAEKQRDLGYLGTYSADRQPAVRELLLEPARAWEAGKFMIAGPNYPAEPYPPNVERVDHIPPAEHPAFYDSLRFALNVTRDDMIKVGHSPSVRLFESAACATPVVSDPWPGLEEFFEPGKEILIAETRADVLGYLRRLPERERREIGARARQRVLREHTAEHRALLFEHYLRELRADRAGKLRAARNDVARGPAGLLTGGSGASAAES
ncbi:MAG TPA: glycosyltransferase [Polyangiaceae bacterium]|nr:glycosyltransferase [Polyangiaceae bacterium]